MTAQIIDCETHSDVDPHVIEFGAAPFDLRDPLEYYDVAVSRHSSPVPIEPGAMAVHGILDEEVADYPVFSWADQDIDAEYLIGHNIDFDWAAVGSPAVKRICTLALARSVWPEAKTHKLMALIFMLDKKVGKAFFETAHSVATDVAACRYVLQQIITKVQPRDMEHLWELSEDARIPSICPIGKDWKGKPIAMVDNGFRRWYRGVTDPGPDPYLLKAFDKYPYDPTVRA